MILADVYKVYQNVAELLTGILMIRQLEILNVA